MKTLFVPTDLSAHSRVALLYGLNLAKAVNASSFVVYHSYYQVLTPEVPVLYTEDLQQVLDDIKAGLEKDVERMLDEVALPRDFMKVTVEVESYTGAAADRIVHAARHHKADLILMGSHGKTGLDKLIFGSVTSAVIESSTLPLLVVPRHYAYRPVDKIAFASTLRYFTHEVRDIFAFSDALRARMEVVHIDYGLLSRQNADHAHKVLEKMGLPDVNLHIVPAVQEDTLKDNLLRWMKSAKPEWLVMFTVKRSWVDRLLMSSKTLDLAMDFRKPMLVLHTAAD